MYQKIFQKKLEKLDPNFLLPIISESLSKMSFQLINDKIKLQGSSKDTYAALNSQETPEFKPFAELFLAKTIQRVLSSLACTCEDADENGLLSNIVKSLVSVITLDEEVGSLENLEKKLKECAQNPELRATISASILAKVGLRNAADLQLVVSPFANAALEDTVWELLNDQLPDLLIKFCEGFKYQNLLSPEQKVSVKKIEGYEALRSDSKVLSAQMMPKIFNYLSKPSNLSMIGHSVKDTLEGMNLEGFDRAWMEQLLKTLAQSDQSTIAHLWKILEEVLAPRLFGMLESMSVQNNLKGNFFENILVNTVNVLQNSIDGKQAILNAGLTEYDKKSVMADACDWRDRYLKTVKQGKAADLTSGDIEEILKLYVVGYSTHEVESKIDPNYAINKIWALKKALDKPEENLVDLLTRFFVEADSEKVSKDKRDCLSRVFGPVADEVLKLIGFTWVKALSLFDVEFAFVRKSVVPLVISMVYRDMSDFKGLNTENQAKLSTYFGEDTKHPRRCIKHYQQKRNCG